MLKWILRIGGLLILIFGVLFWWLMLSGSDAPKQAPDVFDLDDWRSKAAAPLDLLPTEIRVLEVGHDRAPAFAAQAGRFGAPLAMSYNAIEIIYPDKSIIVGGAVDRETAEGMTQSAADWRFSDPAYDALTHEHLDHIMAIARHPDPAGLAPNLVMNAPQIDALPMFVTGALDPALAGLTPRLSGDVESIAPGLVIVPAAGHTPGAQNVFITLQNGEEILLIGDTVWNMGALEALKTRPILTQYVVFRPNYEDRDAVKQQVRALYDMIELNPDLSVLPAHDRTALIEAASVDGISFAGAE